MEESAIARLQHIRWAVLAKLLTTKCFYFAVPTLQLTPNSPNWEELGVVGQSKPHRHLVPTSSGRTHQSLS